MRSGLLRLLLPTFGGLVLALPFAAGAQNIGTAAPISLSASPQYPAPYSQVAVSALSSSFSLSNATLVLVVNGKQLYQGNAQPVAVTLGGPGTVTTIKATLSSNGASYSQTLVLQPQDVALIAEPNASVPALYPGKPLVPLEGNVRLVAVANLKTAAGKALDPAALSYAWTLDNAKLIGSSGIGKSVLIVDSPLQYRGRTVSVVVQSQDGALVGGAAISLNSTTPTVRVYENDPLLGIRFDHALAGAYTITDAESSLYAAPFSFPLANGGPSLQWFLNGSAAESGNSITLRPTGNGQGKASLSLVASDGSYTQATTNFSISFGTKSGSGLFGL